MRAVSSWDWATATSSGLAPARTVAWRDWAVARLAMAAATFAFAWATWASLVVWSSSAIRSPDLTTLPMSNGRLVTRPLMRGRTDTDCLGWIVPP